MNINKGILLLYQNLKDEIESHGIKVLEKCFELKNWHNLKKTAFFEDVYLCKDNARITIKYCTNQGTDYVTLPIEQFMDMEKIKIEDVEF